MRTTTRKIQIITPKKVYYSLDEWCRRPMTKDSWGNYIDSGKSSARFFWCWTIGLLLAAAFLVGYGLAWANVPILGFILTFAIVVPTILYYLITYFRWVCSDD